MTHSLAKEDEMILKKVVALIALILLVSVLGCNLSQASGESTNTTLASSPSMPSLTTNTPEFSLTPSMTLSPTPSLTPLPTLTFTPPPPMVSVSLETNCRKGPGKVFESVGVLHVGETTQVVGQDGYGDNWIVRNPDVPGGTCWLWSKYATVTGDWQSLPVIASPPTPTPLPTPTTFAAFSFEYKSLGVGAGFICLLFNVNNTGTMTWQSYTFNVHDSTQGRTGATFSNNFIDYDGWCATTGSQSDLMAGESGTASVQINLPANPAGDHFDATLELCTGNTLAGTCLTQVLNSVIGP